MVDISVIMPTYNRLDQLKKNIKALETQSYSQEKFEVIVISDGCKDGTDEYLSGISTCLNLHPIFQQNSGAAAARNTGAGAANTELILFLDDDVLPDRDLVQNHVLNHRDAEIKDLVIGPMLTPQDWLLSPWVAWEQSMLDRQYQCLVKGVYKPSSRQFYTGNVSLKREFFFMNGCFDPQFRRGEDVEFAYRAEKLGANFIFNPEAKGYHYAQRSYESWLQTAYAYGVNDVAFTYEKDIDWLLPQLLREYKRRNVFFQAMLPLFLDKKDSQAKLLRLLTAIGTDAYRRNLYTISRMALSGVFNMQYFQGVADKLGGRKKFFTLLRQS